jgi:hypothetical protein
MVLAAVETATKADPIWAARRHESNIAAQATARESVHAASPQENHAVGMCDVPLKHRRAKQLGALAEP